MEYIAAIGGLLVLFLVWSFVPQSASAGQGGGQRYGEVEQPELSPPYMDDFMFAEDGEAEQSNHHSDN